MPILPLRWHVALALVCVGACVWFAGRSDTTNAVVFGLAAVLNLAAVAKDWGEPD